MVKTNDMGKFLVLEGTDGSGKGTHTRLLQEWLTNQGIPTATFDFPRYDEASSYFVKQYLNGEYGQLPEIGPYKASLFYALDRYDAGFRIRTAIADDKFVICNRYVGSNMGHQGGKISDDAERAKYFDWVMDMEYKVLQIPRPTLNLVLLMPAEQSQKFVDLKANRERNYAGGKKRDLHEADVNHLRHAEAAYRELCRRYPETFQSIDCYGNGVLGKIDVIQKQIQNIVTTELLSERVTNIKEA